MAEELLARALCSIRGKQHDTKHQPEADTLSPKGAGLTQPRQTLRTKTLRETKASSKRRGNTWRRSKEGRKPACPHSGMLRTVEERTELVMKDSGHHPEP